jgi:hypothetical protein
LVTISLPTTAWADTQQPISASPPAATLDKDGKAAVTVSNELGAQLGLTLEADDQQGQPLSQVTVTPSATSLAAGASLEVTVDAPSRPDSSTLVVVAAAGDALPTGAVLRIPLSKTAPAKPAVTKWKIVNTQAGSDAGRRLPLTKSCAGLGIEKPTELGVVEADGNDLTVTGSCSDPTAKSLALAISDVGPDGRSYSGTIKVADTDVALTVDNTVSWLLAVLLIFLGIIVALGLTGWRESGRAARDIVRRSRLVEWVVSDRNPHNSDRSFAQAATALELPTNVKQWTIAAAVREKSSELRGQVQARPTEDELKAATEDIASLEKTVGTWPDFANRLGELNHGLEKLRHLEAYSNRIRARTLDRHGPLDLDAIGDIKAAADEAIPLANDWPITTIVSAQTLALAIPDDSPAIGARHDFEALLDQFSAVADIDGAEAALAEFWTVNKELKGATEPEWAFAIDFDSDPEEAAHPSPFHPVETDDPAAIAAQIATEIWAIDLAVVIVLLLAAVFAGMQALWVDKTFGGASDVIAALFWGLGAGTVVQPLAAALTDLGRSRAVANKKA